MRKHGSDINLSRRVMDNSDEAPLVAANIKDRKLSYLIDCIKRALEFRMVLEVCLPANPKPDSQRFFRGWVRRPELGEPSLGDDMHRKGHTLIQIYLILRYFCREVNPLQAAPASDRP